MPKKSSLEVEVKGEPMRVAMTTMVDEHGVPTGGIQFTMVRDHDLLVLEIPGESIAGMLTGTYMPGTLKLRKSG